MILGGKLTLSCAGWASAGFLRLVLGDQGEDALPDQGSGARGGRQTDVRLHTCLHLSVHQNTSLQGERSLLQLIDWLQGFQSLTQSKETCRRHKHISKTVINENITKLFFRTLKTKMLRECAQ